MKKLTLLILTICTFLFSCKQAAEDESIQQTIQTEVDAINTKDLKAFAASWKQSPDVTYAFFSNGRQNKVKGWDSISSMMHRRFADPSQNDSGKITLDSFVIHTSGNTAWVEYNQTLPPSNFPFSYNKSHNYRMLVKENDQWKTISNIVTVPETYVVNNISIERDLNTAGYNLLSQNKMNEAIEVFKLNVKLFPEAWNTYDSLGEAYALAGNKKLAIENYETSIKLNPKSETGIEALVKLKQL